MIKMMQSSCSGGQRRRGIGLDLLSAVCFALLGIASVFLVQSSASAADAGWVGVVLPTKPSDVRGFTCSIDFLNPVSEGYLTMRVTANSTTGPFPGDRSIDVNIRPSFYGMNRPIPNTTYSVSLELPAGTTIVSKVYYIPKYYEGTGFTVSVSENGEILKSYAGAINETLSTELYGTERLITASDWMTRIALIMPDSSQNSGEAWQHIPDMRSLDAQLRLDDDYAANPARLTDREAMDYIKLRSRLVQYSMQVTNAHSNWLGYESTDIVIAPFPLLEEMKRSEPARFKALHDWLACGGVLWTYAAKDSSATKDLFSVEADFSMSNPGIRLSTNYDDFERAVNAFLPELRASKLKILSEPYRFGIGSNISSNELDPLAILKQVKANSGNNLAHPLEETKTANQLRDEMFTHEVAAGVVVGFVSEDPFPGSLQQWFVAKHLSGPNQLLRFRRGINVSRGTSRYWEWLMSTVARPPVYAFLMLFTLFVVLVGPVAYYLARRSGRSYLMFLIAPILAAITTVLLFGYGFVSDGFGTKTRARQITWVDGRTGVASEMNRSTYFAAFRPSNGLKFPKDAAVYPVQSTEEMVGESQYRYRMDRSIRVADSHQIFQGEFLPSRTQAQFVSFKPLTQPVGIKVESSNGIVTIENAFPSTLTSLVYRDENQTYWDLQAPLVAGGSATLKEVDAKKTSSRLRALYSQHAPEVPPGYSANNQFQNTWYEYSSALSMLNSMNEPWMNSTSDIGVHELRLKQLLSERSSLPDNSFVGILESQRDASAVEGAKVIESVHYIMGTAMKSEANK